MTEQTHDPQTNRMVDDEFSNPDGPAGYGIQDPEHPGEPDYWAHPESDPIPGTAKQTRDERNGNRAGQHNTTEGTGHRGNPR
jgi:hypothetical protein